MGKRLERFGEVRIVDEANGFGLDFVDLFFSSLIMFGDLCRTANLEYLKTSVDLASFFKPNRFKGSVWTKAIS